MGILDGLVNVLKRMRAGRDVIGEVEDFWKASHMKFTPIKSFPKGTSEEEIKRELALQLAMRIFNHIEIRESTRLGHDGDVDYYADIEISSERAAYAYVRREEERDRYRHDRSPEFANDRFIYNPIEMHKKILATERVVALTSQGPNANGDIFPDMDQALMNASGIDPSLTDAPAPVAGHWLPSTDITHDNGPALPPPKEDK